MDHNCGGERLASSIDRAASTQYGDTPEALWEEFDASVTNYRERPYGELAAVGLFADSVYRETRRGMEGIAGRRTGIRPGIDIDIPTAEHRGNRPPRGAPRKPCSPRSSPAPRGHFAARRHFEMKLTNLNGAGDAICEPGYA